MGQKNPFPIRENQVTNWEGFEREKSKGVELEEIIRVLSFLCHGERLFNVVFSWTMDFGDG
jgi:hypothetical protein